MKRSLITVLALLFATSALAAPAAWAQAQTTPPPAAPKADAPKAGEMAKPADTTKDAGKDKKAAKTAKGKQQAKKKPTDAAKEKPGQ